jgi:hypothetical protein
MDQISRFLRSVEGDRLGYWCQGCEQMHHVRIGSGEGVRWGYNGNPDKPTFTPSVLYQQDMWVPPVTLENIEQWRAAPWEQHQEHWVCHTFITDGMVQFLGDCTHGLAGQTLPLPELPEHLRD